MTGLDSVYLQLLYRDSAANLFQGQGLCLCTLKSVRDADDKPAGRDAFMLKLSFLGWTQEEIGKAVGMTQQAVSDLSHPTGIEVEFCIPDWAEKEQLSYNTVKSHWIPATNLSEKVKQLTSIAGDTFSDKHAAVLLKYPHPVQDKFAEVCVKKGLTSRQLQELTRKYDENPQADLEEY
ncbi:MAG: helix-turn-helix transcriptional regulator [Acidobacteriia bacterium]|nr:helix-turn-helix transcriptional regulator [Terriglobia bacterium]